MTLDRILIELLVRWQSHPKDHLAQMRLNLGAVVAGKVVLFVGLIINLILHGIP